MTQREALLYLHEDCNYACEYCMLGSPDYQKVSGKAATSEGIQGIINFFNEHSGFHIILSGGEPTVHPEFVRLSTELATHNYLRIDTNGSMAGEKLEQFIQQVNPERVDFFRCALHTVDEEPLRLSQWLQRLLLLKEHTFRVFVEFVVTSERVEKIPEYFNIFMSHGVPFVLAPYRDKDGKYPAGYTPEEMEVIDRYCISACQRSLFETNVRKPLGKPCSAGYSRLNISGISGNIRKCWRGSEVLGNMYENRLNLFHDRQPCQVDSCNYFFEPHHELEPLLNKDLELILSQVQTYDRELYRQYKEASTRKS